MIVNNLDVFGIITGPAKAETKLVINTQAPLARAITLELLEPVAWRCAQIFNASRKVQLLQLSKRRAFEIGKTRHSADVKKRLSVGTLERSNRHRKDIIATRY